MLFLGNECTGQSKLFPAHDGTPMDTSEVEANLKLCFDAALAVFGRNTRDLYLEAA